MNSRMTPRGMVPGSPQQTYHPAPNAALLIDFDNVTMTIRSDLGKELRTLLNSDVIRGKVAVQRAYADWRRYPQYIVPLAENSVDLIFAPAYGSSKKNATDLRMAIDAIELVFTRPEIGTFILMTGDSDFSSCVLKLKEYGKYVIGVGMRESSSDLLIQNCDEYYSYHSLSGLTRAGEVEESKEDPWVLVKRAVQQMVKNGDVMRTDRLKQVMLDLDPGFDEKKVGYSKFSRFVSEAASKGLLRLRKGENGQYEIVGTEAEPEKETREKVVERIVAEAEAGGNGRRRGRRGRDERPREDRPREERPREERPLEETAPAEAAAPEAEAASEAAPAPAEAPVAGGAAAPTDLRSAYSLLQEAVRRLTAGETKAVRDGDVKRRMLEIARDFDESKLGFPKFTRFLRQAHDDEVIDLSRTGNGNYEVTMPAGGKRLPPPEPAAETRAAERTTRAEAPGERERAAAPAARAAAPEEKPAEEKAAPDVGGPAVAAEAKGFGGLRGRRRGGGPGGPPPILPGQTIPSKSLPQSKEEAGTEAAATAASGAPEAPAATAPAATAPPAEEKKGGRSRSRRGRRGSREEAASMASAEGVKKEAQPASGAGETAVEGTKEEAQPVAASPEAAAPKAEERKAGTARGRRGRRGSAAGEAPPPILEGQAVAVPKAAPAPEEKAAPAARSRKRGGRATVKEEPVGGFDAAALGLPTSAEEIRPYLATYKGVGAKTAEALVESFGDGVFDALQNRAAEVTSVLGDRRAKTVLEQWAADHRTRTSGKGPAAAEVTSESAGNEKSASPSRRGGRGSRSRKKEPAGTR